MRYLTTPICGLLLALNVHAAIISPGSGTTSAGTPIGINVTDPPYFAIPGDANDDTTAIQAAIDAAQTTGGTVYLPAGSYIISQLRLYSGVSLVGAGVGSPPFIGTQLLQRDGVNASAIINDPTALPATAYWHWSLIENIQLRKTLPTTDTLGSGIEVNCRSGEALTFRRLMIMDFPVNGIHYKRGGVPLYIDDIHPFRNGNFGIELFREASDTWQMVSLKGISGDGNVNGLIKAGPGGVGNESFHFENIKSETTNGAVQPNVITLDNLLGAVAYIENVSAIRTGSPAGNAVVRILTSAARVHMHAVRMSGLTYLIDDVFGGRTVADPGTNAPFFKSYHSNAFQEYSIDTTNGLVIGAAEGIKRHMMKTATWDPPEVADGAFTTTTVAHASAVLGDVCTASFSLALGVGARLSVEVHTNASTRVTLWNNTGAPLDLNSGTLKVQCWKL